MSRDRITELDLRREIEELNEKSLNRYGLDGAYSGYKLVQYVGESGAIRELTYGYVPKRELYAVLCGINRYLYLEQRERQKRQEEEEAREAAIEDLGDRLSEVETP